MICKNCGDIDHSFVRKCKLCGSDQKIWFAGDRETRLIHIINFERNRVYPENFKTKEEAKQFINKIVGKEVF